MSIRGLSCITEILNGRRAITGDTALRLGVNSQQVVLSITRVIPPPPSPG